MRKYDDMQTRVLDLFCGAGGSSWGAQSAGCRVVAGIDIADSAIATYKRNFPDAAAIKADIRTINPSALKKTIGRVDLLIGSPECTHHSCARGAAPRNEESRLTAFEVIRYAKIFRPKIIVVENVPQMATWSRHQDILDDLWQLGYFVRQDRLDSYDFGVPQTRRRLFLICTLGGEPLPMRSYRYVRKSASTVLDRGTAYPTTPLYRATRSAATIARAERAMACVGRQSEFLLVYYGSDGSGGWQPLTRPLRTVTTLDRFALVTPKKEGHQIRMLQPPELQVAMGFPKKFKIEASTRRESIRLLGNAVCPPVMRNIVRSMNGIL